MEPVQCQTDREEAIAEVRAALWRNSKFRLIENGELQWTATRIIN